ncbi:MAG: hypothetical protein KDA41_10500, partial [Planctomycetales bacterium]|nr:hypothetical protein [Planctomycetales bacterium]
MSFDPKIVAADDAGPAADARGEQLPAPPLWDDAEALELPDGLAAIAEQLRDDAIHLAACHPADATPQQRAIACGLDSPPPKWRWLRRAARWSGVAAAIALAPAGWLMVQALRESPTPVVETARSDAPPRAGGLRVRTLQGDAALSAVRPAEEASPGLREIPSATPRVVPAAFLQEVSGPELEGMLDLLEQDDAEL